MSRVQICNRALTAYLGEQTITSLDEDTPAAQQCKLHYEDTRDSLLERHWWSFANGRKALAVLTNDRPDEWLFKYQYPTEALAIRWVNDPEAARLQMVLDQSPDTEREIEGDAIYSDVPGAVCAYTRVMTDEARFPRHFRNALSAAMAEVIALPLTQSARLAGNAVTMAETMLDRAIALDQRNSPPAEAAVPHWLSDRGVS